MLMASLAALAGAASNRSARSVIEDLRDLHQRADRRNDLGILDLGKIALGEARLGGKPVLREAHAGAQGGYPAAEQELDLGRPRSLRSTLRRRRALA